MSTMSAKGARKAKGCGHVKGGVGWCAKCVKGAMVASRWMERAALKNKLIAAIEEVIGNVRN